MSMNLFYNLTLLKKVKQSHQDVKKKDLARAAKPFTVMVRLAGFEPAACGLEVRCSIQLSYRRRGFAGVLFLLL
jgi:hypothetical protein